MRKLVLLFLFFPAFCFSQVSGIGIFKIGNSKKYILDEIKRTSSVDLIVYTDIMEEIKGKKHTDKTESVTSLDSKAFQNLKSPGFTFDSLRQNIDVNYYVVSGMPFKNIGLVFYNDTLIRFRCNGTDSVFEAVKAKYKEPRLTMFKDTIKCINKLTGSFDLVETVNKYSWNNPENNIQADYLDEIKYDSRCDKNIVLEFVICDTNKWKATLAKSLHGVKIDPNTLKDF